jgi:hypothetical protein
MASQNGPARFFSALGPKVDGQHLSTPVPPLVPPPVSGILLLSHAASVSPLVTVAHTRTHTDTSEISTNLRKVWFM